MLEAARTGPLVRAAGEGLAVECFGTRYVVKATAAGCGRRTPSRISGGRSGA